MSLSLNLGQMLAALREEQLRLREREAAIAEEQRRVEVERVRQEMRTQFFLMQEQITHSIISRAADLIWDEEQNGILFDLPPVISNNDSEEYDDLWQEFEYWANHTGLTHEVVEVYEDHYDEGDNQTYEQQLIKLLIRPLF